MRPGDLEESGRLARRALLAWYRRTARDLPWRRARDPYRIWLSEIMLQQTRVDQAIPYYGRFLAAFPNVTSLASAKEEQVLKLWEGLGYYSRARNLHKAAKIIAGSPHAAFPQTAAEWQRLPGIGRYTAGAIASIAFGQPAPVLDGNVKRVLARLFNIAASIDATRTQKRLWALAEALVPARSPGDFNQAMMELGARVCAPARPHCTECPVRKHCKAYARGVQARRPVRRPKKPIPHRHLVAVAINKNGRYLLVKRPPGGLLAGLWECPSLTPQPGETHTHALARAARKLGIRIIPGDLLTTVQHAYSHFRVTLHVYRCTYVSGALRPGDYAGAKWVRQQDLSLFPLPKTSHKFLHLLAAT